MKSLYAGLALLFIPLLVYWSSIHGEFHYDDIHHIVENEAVRHPGGLLRFFTDPAAFSSKPGVEMYRPALMLTYVFNYSLGGLDPKGWHLFNILLHGINALLLFAIALKLLGRRDAAFICGLIFAVHPVAGESVNYISSRSSLLLAAFFLSAFLVYRHGTESGRGRSWPWLAALNVLYVLALLTKESAVALPALIIVNEYLSARHNDGRKDRSRRLALRILPLVIVTAAYLILRKLLLDVILSPVDTRPVLANLFTESKAYFFYLRLLLWPVHLSVDHGFPVENSMLSPRVLLALTALMLILLSFAYLARSRNPSSRTLSLTMAWYFLTLIPTSSIVPLNMLVNERRVYLPLAAFAAAAAILYNRIRPRAPRFIAGSFGFIIVLFCVLVLARNQTWNSEARLWRDAYRKAPENHRAARGLADYYFYDSRLERALQLYRSANALEPDNAQTLHNIGLILDMLGKPREALAELKRAHELDPNNSMINLSLASAYDHTGAVELARFHLEEATALDPDHAMAHNNLGKIYHTQGDLRAAEREYRAALRIEPEQELANFNLGVLLTRRGMHNEALPYLQAAFIANPSYPDNAFQLGLCMYRLHRWDASRKAFLKAVELNPDWKQAWYNLGLVEGILGNQEASQEAFMRSGMEPPENFPENP